MTVAVTGASGVLGRPLVEQLLAAGVRVIAIVREKTAQFPPGVEVRHADILDFFALHDAVQGADTMIHAAALVSFNPRRRDEIIRVNVEGTRNAINACLKEGIRNFIQISSVAALGRRLGALIDEEIQWTGQYANAYATSKYLAELEVYRGSEEGLTVSLVNPSVILNGTPAHRSSSALFDYAWKGRPFYTDGMLNYVDVRDVIQAVLKLVNHPMPGERFILCGGSTSYRAFFSQVALQWKKRAPAIRIPNSLVTLFGVAEEIRCRLIGAEPLVTRDSAAVATRHFQYDTTKSEQVLGLRYHNLTDTLAWCCTQYSHHVRGNK